MATAARPVRPVKESSCGLPGDLEHSDDTKSWTNPKVGGKPVFPGSVPHVEAAFCAKCGRQLSLVAQVSSKYLNSWLVYSTDYQCRTDWCLQVPATAHQGHIMQDRVLMLWACTAETCVAEPASWRAISCMLPVTTALPPHSITASSNHVQAMPAELDWTSMPADQPTQYSSDSGAWGSAANDWGSPTASPQPSTTPSPHSVFDYRDLEQALDSYQQYDRPQHSSKGKQAASALPRTADADSCSMDLHGSQLPGFYVNMVPEAAAMKADMSADDRHIAELLAAYEQANQEVCAVKMAIAPLCCLHGVPAYEAASSTAVMSKLNLDSNASLTPALC